LLAGLGLLAACTGGRARPDAPAPATASSAPAAKAAPGTAQSAPAPTPNPNLKPFAEVSKDFKRSEGLFAIHQKDERFLLELKEDDFDKPFFFTLQRTRGIGERGIYAGQMLESGVGVFRKYSDRVLWIEQNTSFVAPGNPPLARAVAEGYSDSLRASAAILSQPHPQSRAILVDASAFVVTDAAATAALLAAAFRQPYQFDRSNSLIEAAQTEPTETRFAVRTHYAAGTLATPQPGQANAPTLPRTLPDPRSLFLGQAISFSPLPEPMAARRADPRVGYFSSGRWNYGNDLARTPREYFINRWRLEKADPTATVSAPKQPIVYWLDRNVPQRYREAVTRGVLRWNAAFERIGFRDAIQVKQQPDDANWSTTDRKHASIKWFLGVDNLAAIGPSLVDHRSGEILDADILITDFWTRLTRAELIRDIAPAPESRGHADCHVAASALQDMAATLDLLIARGEIAPDSPEAEAYVQDTLSAVVTHEVGHTLGLTHNFRASSAYSLAQLRDPAFVAQHGIAASVMDYLPPNVAPAGEPVTAYTQNVLGPYDYWAIEYGYAPLAPEEEADRLADIASRAAADPRLAYADDAEAGGTELGQMGIDPAVARHDLGNDPLAFFQQRLQLSRELWARLATAPPRGLRQAYDERLAVELGLQRLGAAAGNLARVIGGVTVRRHASADARDVYQPLPPTAQRASLAALAEGLFQPASLQLDPALLRRLAPDPVDSWHAGATGLEPQLPLLARVLQLQSTVLDQLFSDRLSQRLVEAELLTPAGGRFSLAELHTRLREEIWRELPRGQAISLTRRALQRAHLSRLVALILRANSTTPAEARAVARDEAHALQTRLRAALQHGKLENETGRHLRECQATLREALNAPLLKQVP
jgi:hypothetical protein